MFSKGPAFFVDFVCNDEALNFCLQLIALPVSVMMSRPAKTTKKLDMSGLAFLALVLQSSNSFDLKAFSQVLFSLILTVYKDHIQLLYLGAVYSKGLFGWG